MKPLDTPFRWDDIVLPPHVLTQLRDLAARAQRLAPEDGDGKRSERGDTSQSGLCALFTGPSGTGRTMAAQILARELGRKLLHVDATELVGKFIGETEKNLSRVFSRARGSEAVLLFDEADALFGRRTEVRNASDRYANAVTDYLLSRIETFAGLVILKSNSGDDIDIALKRQGLFIVAFPYPDEQDRSRIWRKVFPVETTLAQGVDHALLGRRFRLTGRQIRNAAMAAARTAGRGDGVVHLQNVAGCAERERDEAD
ncbi:MAG: AAA family ATPase [Pseudomonadales bacterium]|jgi:SpoVK/Ycf46/Vps4 family AAA+-type ATPase|nr:AAA family ATPase [Pseudomonadales bacterium]